MAEFGTNTGRQGTFNPRDAIESAMAKARLRTLESQYGPRLAVDYVGSTRLNPLDGEGFAKLVNAQREADTIKRLLMGQAPRGMRVSRDRDALRGVALSRRIGDEDVDPVGRPVLSEQQKRARSLPSLQERMAAQRQKRLGYA